MLETRRDFRDIGRLVESPQAAARAALDAAVAFTASRLGGGDTVALLKAGNPIAHDYFRYGLARHLAAYLASADGTAKAVFLNPWGQAAEEMESDPVGVTSPLSIIIWLGRQTAAFAALTGAVDSAITEGYAELVAPAADGLRSLLDVNLVEDREVEDRTGYGALITSTREKPLQVWPAT